MNYRKIILILCLGIFIFAEKDANAQSDTTFGYTGAAQTWTVPCASLVTVTLYGAQGGASNICGSQSHGYGGKVVGTLTVTPGEIINVYVGGQGQEGQSNGASTGGFNGGGQGQNAYSYYGGGAGGGASDL